MSARLAELAAQLEPDAISVLEQIAERMVMGRKQYGDLVIANDRRDWRRETKAELLDACVYIACALNDPKE